MGLGTWLLEKTFEKAAVVAVGAAAAGTAVVVGGTVAVAEKIIDKKAEERADKKRIKQENQMVQAKKELADQELKIVQEKKELAEQKNAQTRGKFSEYDICLDCAKVAICSYIIYADNQVTDAECFLINSILENIYNKYGPEIYERVAQAYRSSTKSFMIVQDYLRKVNLKDIKMYLSACDEVAEVDGIDESELKAIQRIKDYIEQQEIGSTIHLVCPSCSGLMNTDEYGYKATCASCGREMIVDAANAPSSAYR